MLETASELFSYLLPSIEISLLHYLTAACVFLLSLLYIRLTRTPPSTSTLNITHIPPAHPLAPYTSLWIAYIRFRARENRTLKTAHDRLGPVVRLGPTEISVNCVKGGIREVYGGAFEKGDALGGYNWYEFFGNYGG